MEFQQLKQIERLINNSPDLKDYKKEGLNVRNEPKEGYVRLKDNRVIKLSELDSVTKQVSKEIDALKVLAEQYPELYNCKNICKKKDGSFNDDKFLELNSGKVVSVSKLLEAHALTNKDLDKAKNITVNQSEQLN